MRLGNHRIACRKRERVGQDDYGNDIVRTVDTPIRWCLVTPTRSTEDDTRSAPAVAGATILAPVDARLVEAADSIIWPITGETIDAEGRVTYQGRTWGVVGDVGLWDEHIEFQVRRTS